MEATAITSNPWSDGGETTVQADEETGSGGLAGSVTTSEAPLAGRVEEALNRLGLTIEDLLVFGTIANTAGLIVAALKLVGWL